MKNKDFDIALKYVLRFEGGYVNDNDDNGGATNKGVTQKTYNDFLSKTNQPPRSVFHITDNELEQIYYKMYWMEYSCSLLPSPLNIAVFDFCVNAGSNGIRILQKCLGVTADGIFGTNTLNAVYDFCVSEERVNELVKKYLSKRKQYYLAIVTRRPTQLRFIKGWNNRVTQLSDLLVSG